jgi:hypothetical protein
MGARIRNQRMSKCFVHVAFWCLCILAHLRSLPAQIAPDPCPRPAPGSVISAPEDLRSHNGVLKVELTAFNGKQPDGSVRYCFLDGNGNQSPTIRVSPGDLVILTLKNDL